MPNVKAAAKALRQTKKRTARNRQVKSGVEIALRHARRAIVNKSSEASKLVAQAIKLLDKASKSKTLKRNTAARLKSRLTKAFNKSKK